MKNLIVCFSGTGNTYYVASKIAETLDDCKIEMISNINNENFIMPERLGIFFPIHVCIEPRIINQFISNILGKSKDKETLKYVYSISTAGSNILLYGNKRVDKELKDVGITLSYAANVKMPNNYYPKNSDEENKKIIEKANIKINHIAEELNEEEFRFPKWKPKLFGFLLYLIYNSMSKHYPEDFKVTDACINCGICYRECPTNNITMIDKKPTFGNNCLACTSCINSCPTNAIYRKKMNEKQYKNPLLKFEQVYRQ